MLPPELPGRRNGEKRQRVLETEANIRIKRLMEKNCFKKKRKSLIKDAGAQEPRKGERPAKDDKEKWVPPSLGIKNVN